MTADPKNPKVGDRFLDSFGCTVEVLGTGRSRVFASDGNREFLASLPFVAEYWKPAPEPLVIYEVDIDPPRWWSSPAGWTGRKRILHPDGTWTEEGP